MSEANLSKGTTLRLRIAKYTPRYIAYLIAIILSGIFIIPFIWMIFGSFKPDWDIMSIPPRLFPQAWTIANYPALFSRLPMIRLYLNSIFVTASIVLIQVTTSAILGFVLSKYVFPGRDIFFVFVLSTMMVPFFVLMVPLFRLVVQLGWADSYKGLIFTSILNSFGIFLLRQFSNSIPDELLDAARIDGASEPYIFTKIALPLLSPALSALAIFVFIGQWSSYLWPLIVITKSDLRTLPLGLALLNFTAQGNMAVKTVGASAYGVLLAGNVLAVVPVLIVFFILQRRITEGITLTGMGGH
jgi:multiple sugar transport system permease protein